MKTLLQNKKTRASLMLAILGGMLLPCAMPAQSADGLNEYEIKAAFLVNFVRFVEWPSAAFSNTQSAVGICIYGEDPFGEAANALKAKIVAGRPLTVRRIRGIKDTSACHILFIGNVDERQLADLLTAAAAKNILTVGESQGFMAAGGMIRFVLEDSKVHLEINVSKTEAAALKVSAKLLSVAKVIHGESGK